MLDMVALMAPPSEMVLWNVLVEVGLRTVSWKLGLLTASGQRAGALRLRAAAMTSARAGAFLGAWLPP